MEYQGIERRTPSDFDDRIISKAEMRETFKEAADGVVADVFKNLGVDVTDQKQVNSLRDNFVWLGEVKAASADAVKTVRRAALTIVSGAIIASLWIGFKDKLGL